VSRMTLDVFDGRPPVEGSVVVKRPSGRRHLVLSVRPVDSRQWHDRWALETRPLRPDEPNPPGAEIVESWSYQKGDCPACIARAADVPVPDFVVCR
jgi:hypothetical protein